MAAFSGTCTNCALPLGYLGLAPLPPPPSPNTGQLSRPISQSWQRRCFLRNFLLSPAFLMHVYWMCYFCITVIAISVTSGEVKRIKEACYADFNLLPFTQCQTTNCPFCVNQLPDQNFNDICALASIIVWDNKVVLCRAVRLFILSCPCKQISGYLAQNPKKNSARKCDMFKKTLLTEKWLTVYPQCNGGVSCYLSPVNTHITSWSVLNLLIDNLILIVMKWNKATYSSRPALHVQVPIYV